jgi:hypothetical protein
MTFSGVTLENWVPTRWVYFASFARASMLTATPSLMPFFAARDRSVLVVSW